MAKSVGPMNNLVRQAQLMQQKMEKMRTEMDQRLVSATSGGGMVTVEANGANELVSLKLEREVVNPEDVDMLQDLILAAANEALKKAQDMVSEEMSKITQGLNIPGLF